MERHVFEHQNRIAKSIASSYSADSIEKAGQAKEGSRGGKVIGHTKSGKPIYDQPNHSSHSKFSHQDHLDAVSAHDHMSQHQTGHPALNGVDPAEHEKRLDKHWQHAQSMKYTNSGKAIKFKKEEKEEAPKSETHRKLHEHIDSLKNDPNATWAHAGSLAQIHSELATAHDETQGGNYTAHNGYSKTLGESFQRHSEGAKSIASKLDEKTLKTYWEHGNPDKMEKSVSYVPDGKNLHRDVAGKVFGSYINAHNNNRMV